MAAFIAAVDRCVALDDGPVGHEGIRDGLGHLRRGAVIEQGRIGVTFGLGDGGEVHGVLGLREVIGQRRGDGSVGFGGRVVPAELGEHPGLAGLRGQQGVGLSGAVGVAAEGQRPIIICPCNAQGSDGVQVPHLVCTGEQVPSDLALPGGGVNEIGGSAQSGDFCEQAVYGGLQRDLQRRQLAAEGPGALQRQDGGVLQGLPGVVGALGDVALQRRGEVAACLVSGGLEGCEQRLRRVQAAVSHASARRRLSAGRTAAGHLRSWCPRPAA
eukprot:s8498_g3.t1